MDIADQELSIEVFGQLCILELPTGNWTGRIRGKFNCGQISRSRMGAFGSEVGVDHFPLGISETIQRWDEIWMTLPLRASA